jgi:hypothetical protein
VGLTFERVTTAETSAIVAFLSDSDWPFHAATRLSVAEAEAINISNAATRSFWIRDAGTVSSDLSDCSTSMTSMTSMREVRSSTYGSLAGIAAKALVPQP